jgi:hypothetical protein
LLKDPFGEAGPCRGACADDSVDVAAPRCGRLATGTYGGCRKPDEAIRDATTCRRLCDEIEEVQGTGSLRTTRVEVYHTGVGLRDPAGVQRHGDRVDRPVPQRTVRVEVLM